ACDVDWRDRYSENMHVADKNATEGSAANQAWCFYEILDPEDAKITSRPLFGNEVRMVTHGSK
ncbi:MAG: hypothetical protein IKS76_01865, partial [Paludibacteraceae bacterium]|nr:hypothetical protein [Paludibacteraceae bacterium]